jgi:hypothetical protein
MFISKLMPFFIFTAVLHAFLPFPNSFVLDYETSVYLPHLDMLVHSDRTFVQKHLAHWLYPVLFMVIIYLNEHSA